MYKYNGTVKRVIDGDSLVVEFDLGFKVKIEKTVRLARIDAYEKTLRNGQTEEEKKIGIEATNYVKELLEGKTAVFETYKDSGKYGRYIADVYYQDENINLNDQMVKLGYAKLVTY